MAGVKVVPVSLERERPGKKGETWDVEGGGEERHWIERGRERSVG